VSSDDFVFRIEVPVRNEWSNVNLLVLSVQHCFSAMFADIEGSHAVAMVTGELLENAIKYGAWKKEGEHLRLSVAGRRGRARLTVENPAAETAYRELERTLRWAEGHADAATAYRARLLTVAQTTDPDASQLGIVRIMHEGRCKVSAEYTDGIVRVSADMQL
jgi:hypothetical protein